MPTTWKLGLISLLCVVLIIPLFWINQTILEREKYYQKSLDLVAKSWSQAQRIVGPLILVPYVDKADPKQPLKEYVILPSELNASVVIHPEVRHRGIFEVTVYQADIAIQGSFSKFLTNEHPKKEFYWNQAKLILPISDLRGINSVKVTSDGQPLPIKQGTESLNAVISGVHAVMNLNPEVITGSTGMHFDVSLNLKGTDSINFLPIGKDTKIDVKSTWPDPSFIGQFLPVSREIKASGFEASWKIPYLARHLPESFDSKLIDQLFEKDAFGIRLLKAADHYKQAERATKYCYIFILYTFLAFFLFEVVKKIKIHIFQYGITACSLLCFFVLLTAFSEHLSFNIAYLLAATAIVAQVSLYTFKMVPDVATRVTFSVIFAALYGCLFWLLRLEDYAFLMGSLLMFSILSLTMYYTRNVKWYDGEGQSKSALATA